MEKSSLHPTPVIGNNALEKFEKVLRSPDYCNARLYVLTDSNTLGKCLPVFESIAEQAQKAEIIEIPAGEENKDLDICKGIWQSLLELGADRDSVLINLGGGTVTDLGGFCASAYMRGIRFFNIPTSLMGMADAGFGGKNGIDLEGVKNMIGTFAIPQGVYIYPPFLETLPEKELQSGFAEIIKTALIADEDLWEQIIRKNYQAVTNWLPLIRKSAAIKMSVVEMDPVETGLRKVLNFGHTIGHALEARSRQVSKKPLTHGEAVAAGLICESYLSWKSLGLPESLLGTVSDVVLENFPWKSLPGGYEELAALMQNDKKNAEGNIHFTLIAGIGQVMINQHVPGEWIKESLAYYHSLKS